MMWVEKCNNENIGKARARKRGAQLWFKALGLFAAVFLFTFLVQKFGRIEKNVEAANLANFDPGYIISDYQMGNYNSMSEEEIQAFLISKNPCNNTNYNAYVSLTNTYSNIKWHFENGHFICLSEELFGDGEEIGSGETAARIIWQAAQDYKINPQVLIVLLQKEQGLITDDFPNSRQYRSATGYGCPDTAACSSKYYGFKNQVRRAAAMFRTVLDGGWTNYPLGENYIQYNPTASCGGSIVNIKNLATSALYRYTPYQPNAAALSAGYGTAYCGAYGNRNFYSYFEDWFGGILKEEPINTELNGGEVAEEGEISNGLYTIASITNKKVIDIKYGVTKNSKSGEITVWDKKGIYDDTTNQVFEIKYDKNTGYYKILNHLSGMALDVKDVAKVDGAPVIMWEQNSGCNQSFKIAKKDEGYEILSACTGKALELSGEGVVINTKKATDSQKWMFEKVAEKENLDGDYIILANENDGLSLDISGGVSKNTKNGEAIIYEKKATGNLNQTFRIKKDEDSDYYYIYNPTANLYLDVADGVTTDGAGVIFWPYNGGCNQKWAINKESNYYLITSSCTKKALDVKNGKVESLANIIMYKNHGGVNQQWLIEKIK